MEFRTLYNRNETDASEDGPYRLGQFIPEGESLAKQEFKDECDINQIMKRYQKYGVLPPGNEQEGMYGDFSQIGDLLESQAIVDEARERFAELPSSVRDRFSNDPAALIAFVQDGKNREEAQKLGLIPTPEVVKKPEPQEVVIVETKKKAVSKKP